MTRISQDPLVLKIVSNYQECLELKNVIMFSSGALSLMKSNLSTRLDHVGSSWRQGIANINLIFMFRMNGGSYDCPLC
jgi:hypothetical protein